MKKTYLTFDKDHNGGLSFKEFLAVVDEAGLLDYKDTDEWKEVYDQADTNHDGKLTFEEFIHSTSDKKPCHGPTK